MQGLHLTADLAGCPAATPAMTDPGALRALCLARVGEAGLTVVGDRFHGFLPERGEPRGVTGVVLLAESHLAVHTWPELGRVTLDVYVCHRSADNSDRARALIDALVAVFGPGAVERHALARGAELSA